MIYANNHGNFGIDGVKYNVIEVMKCAVVTLCRWEVGLACHELSHERVVDVGAIAPIKGLQPIICEVTVVDGR